FRSSRGWTRVWTDPDLAALLTTKLSGTILNARSAARRVEGRMPGIIKGLVGAAFLAYFFLLLKRSRSHACEKSTTEQGQPLRVKTIPVSFSEIPNQVQIESTKSKSGKP
ncbi:MAG: hypothetical protein QNJ69_15000, partial [Gammaproteobacteria bacterium]|nr:hypothetical protein [Gammaproteobacteria bacterium]